MPAQPFDWSQFYLLAKELATRDGEACHRSSLSRAYYYVYNIALARAVRNGYARREGESSHAQLWRVYSLSPEPECVRLGQVGLRLKGKREQADYEKHYPRIHDELPILLNDAEDFAGRLASLAPRFPNPASMRQ
jgi:hypothetical protein